MGSGPRNAALLDTAGVGAAIEASNALGWAGVSAAMDMAARRIGKLPGRDRAKRPALPLSGYAPPAPSSISHIRRTNAWRQRRPRRPTPPAVLTALREAGAEKARGAPPLSRAQIDKIVAILRQAGDESQHQKPFMSEGRDDERFAA